MRSGKVVAGLFSLLMCGSMAFSAFSETGNLQVDADSSDFYFRDSFESSTDDWSGRGAVSFDVSTKYAYVGNGSLLVSDRTSAWNGVFKALDPKIFVPGKSYSFSANVMYTGGVEKQVFYMKLQYVDSEGETIYSPVAEVTAIKGEWAQLKNTSYTIPTDAEDMQLYIETAEEITPFYVDDAAVAADGTEIEGAKPLQIVAGDIDADGRITVADTVMLKNGLIDGFSNNFRKLCSDVDSSGRVTINDLVALMQYMTGQISEFPVAEPELPVVDTAKMDALFSGIKLASSYKKAGEGNPLFTQRFGADPGVMEYDGRVYVYTTNDVVEYATDGSVAENTYGKINKINCISSDDMVNWTDHGAIPVAGKDGIAKFAGNSWAPCAAHKKINGKEKFFLYFCNGGNGVCVLTSDSPTGPWSDPLGAPLVTRSVPNCGNIAWLFDPAVFVDNDGTGYLCFGGGPDGKSDTTRVVKLSDDMIHLDGTPVTINAPYVFEDSGINRIGDKYYYTYCSNWNTGGNPYGLSTAAIEYMVADNPLGPYTYAGELFKNQGNFFPGMTGNNHHSIVEFKGQLYLFYHSRPVEKAMGITGNYRSPQVDKITMNGEKFNPVTGTMKGIPQLKELDPYSTVQAETMSDQAGINVSGVGNTVVSEIQSGDWIKVSGVDFSKGTNTLTVKVSSNSGGVIKVCTGSNTGKAIGYVEIPEFTTAKEITVPVNDISGTEDLFFVFSGNLEFDYWYFS